MPWELSLQCLTSQEEEDGSLQGLVNFSHWCRHSTKCIWPNEPQRAAFPLSEVSKLFYILLNHQQRRVCSWERMWKLPVLHSEWSADGKYHTWLSLYQLELCILWFLGKLYLRNGKDISNTATSATHTWQVCIKTEESCSYMINNTLYILLFNALESAVYFFILLLQ